MILLQVKQDGFFPADLLFLASTNAYGVCYIETANLDGETNLKIRKALEKTWDYLTPEKASEFKGEIQCEQPNNSLYTFTGNLLIQKQTLPLPKLDSFANYLSVFSLGYSLRNTEYIVGVVIFTGQETKLNSILLLLSNSFLLLFFQEDDVDDEFQEDDIDLDDEFQEEDIDGEFQEDDVDEEFMEDDISNEFQEDDLDALLLEDKLE
ncbi:unnamed protein product [Vicia faba]|uniref:Uncharacterized protein n=1 Tax=Vicia faba TaxID=3906 RepID=A0AAV0ZT01_VICFA|nr:unnamed protein product [Vicia faba]